MPRGKSRGSKSSSPQKSTTTTQPIHQQSQSMDTDGWTTKKSRQHKHNRRKPAAQTVNPSKSNKKQSKASKRRQRAKQKRLNQASNNNVDEKQPEIDIVINDIIRCWPRFKKERDVLLTVVQQMKLKSFDADNEKLKLNILDRINKIKMQQLIIDEDDDENTNNTTNNTQYTQSSQSKLEPEEDDEDEDDDEEEEDEEDEEDFHDDDMDEDDDDDDDEEEEEEDEDDEEEEDQNDDEEEEEESTEPKESYEAPPKSDNESVVDDDKKSIESQREEPQRRRKRKRKRKKKNQSQSSLIQQQIEDDQHDEQSQQDESLEITQKSSISRSPSQSTPHKQRRNKRRKKKLIDRLRDLDINDIGNTSQQLNEWIGNLRSDNQQFLNAFIKANGIEIIVEKLVLNLRDMTTSTQQQQENSRLLSSQIITLFDILLSGTREYHEWLYNELIKLSSKLKELSKNQSNDKDSNDRNNNDDLIDIITEQTRRLVHAQTKKLNNNNEIEINRDNLRKPSSLLHGGHQDTDPILGVVRNLDSECQTLSDLLYALRRHDSRILLSCPTSSERFRIEYNQIKQNLSSSISFITSKSHTLNRELFTMKSKESDLQKQEEYKLAPLKSNLQQHQEEKYSLLAEKQRIEQELNSINQRLKKCDMFIQDTNQRISEIKQLFKPKTESLFQKMTNHQFEIAGFGQQSSIYDSLLQIVNDSYITLSSWSNSRLQTDNDQRSKLERNYINHLAGYLNQICDANMMVIDRVNQLKQHIESFKKTNEITNKYYGQQRNIDQQLKTYEKDIICDEETNENIKNDCYKHIDRAANIVSPQLFKQFINHISNQPIAKILDLTKYKQLIQDQQQIHSQQQQQQQSQRRSMHNHNAMKPSRNTVSTQTQQPSHVMNNGHHPHHVPHHQQQQQQQQQQHTTNESGRGRIKPPMTKSSNIQNTNNTHQQQRSGLKPPRSHYQQQQQQQQQARRAPMRSGRQQFQQY